MTTPVGIAGSEYRELEIVNIVASGTLGVGEVDTDTLGEDLDVVKTVLPGRLYLKRGEDDPVAMVFRSGSVTVAGASTWNEVLDTVQWLSEVLNEVGLTVEEEALTESVVVKYLVVTGSIDTSPNLAEAAITLGMEHSEYEPEQFPALIYRPEQHECTVLVFSNGKITITGARDVESAYEVFEHVRESLRVVQH